MSSVKTLDRLLLWSGSMRSVSGYKVEQVSSIPCKSMGVAVLLDH